MPEVRVGGEINKESEARWGQSSPLPAIPRRSFGFMTISVLPNLFFEFALFESQFGLGDFGIRECSQPVT